MSIWQKIKQAFRRYLERLEKENRETFGSGRPDCCSLNRDQASRPPVRKD